MPETSTGPEITWDHGTAYDLFASLYVIHMPDEFGLRSSWAAGIRSRLSVEVRDLFAALMLHLGIPAPWLCRLSQPKDARSVLERLENMVPGEILPELAINPEKSEQCDGILRDVLERGKWDQNHCKQYLACVGPAHIKAVQKDTGSIERWLDCWARPAEFGLAFRRGLEEFYESFFREEERRIAADIERSLQRAKDLASRLSPAQLFEELSKGIRVEYHLAMRALVLVPCWWVSPRILYTSIREDEEIVLFGARPPEASLIPGDLVPGQLLLALEALSDPTRLAILRALVEQPLTQAEIARRLRLRPPTISHHLKHLRLAGLIAYIGTGREETRYGARAAQLAETCSALKDFLRMG